MRVSFYRMIGVFCAISIGIITVTPFVSTTDASDYWAEIDFYVEIRTCNHGFSHGEVIKDTNPRIFRFHEPQTHNPSAHSITYNYYYSSATINCDGRDHGDMFAYTWG